MLNYGVNGLIALPEIAIYMNCDTRLAINLSLFDLGDNDEFIFAIKNYDYVDSAYVFLFKARKADINEDGEVIFKITSRASKKLKPGAFYNFAILANAHDRKTPTEYKKLTENGNITIEYGAQDVLVQKDFDIEFSDDIVAARLAPLDTVIIPEKEPQVGEALVGRLEAI